MKNNNLNASVATYWSSMNNIREKHASYLLMLRHLEASKCEEFWPAPDRTRAARADDPKPVYEIKWGLRIGSENKLRYDLDVTKVGYVSTPAYEELEIAALERVVQLRRALEDYIHRGGDYPTPNHMPGGSQLAPG